MSKKIEYRLLKDDGKVSRETRYKSLDEIANSVVKDISFYDARITIVKWEFDNNRYERELIFTGRSDLFCVLYINNFFH